MTDEEKTAEIRMSCRGSTRDMIGWFATCEVSVSPWEDGTKCRVLASEMARGLKGRASEVTYQEGVCSFKLRFP